MGDAQYHELTEEYLEMLSREAEQGYDVSKLERRLTGNLPCPICGEWGGFHNDDIHRQDIDPKYLLEKGWQNA